VKPWDFKEFTRERGGGGVRDRERKRGRGRERDRERERKRGRDSEKKERERERETLLKTIIFAQFTDSSTKVHMYLFGTSMALARIYRALFVINGAISNSSVSGTEF